MMLTIKDTERLRTREDATAFIMEKGLASNGVDARDVLAKIVPKEPKYQAAILKWMRANLPGAFIWKDQAGQYQMGGIPDILAIINGQFYGFEVKRPYFGRVSPLQAQTHMAMRKAGGRVHIVSYASEVEAILRQDGVLK